MTCRPEVYRSVANSHDMRPWIMWCADHSAAGGDTSWRGIVAHCPSEADAIALALAHVPGQPIVVLDDHGGEAVVEPRRPL